MVGAASDPGRRIAEGAERSGETQRQNRVMSKRVLTRA